MAPSNRPKILVGLDFGTTFSGISYTVGESKTQMMKTTTLQWGSGSVGLPKLPTQIKLPEKSVGMVSPSNRNGNNPSQSPCVHLVEWFKLSLTDEIDLPEPIRRSNKLQETIKIRQDLGYTAYEVTEKFLGGVWELFLKDANKDKLIRDVGLFDIDLTIAAPLFWSESNEKQLKNVAEHFQKLTPAPTVISVSFMSEPEASFRGLVHDEPMTSKLTGGDAIIICDCGGGTIDSVAYQIAAGPTPAIEEMLLNSSALGGAVTQEETFFAKLKEKIADKMEASDFAALTTADFLPLMDLHWQGHLKKRYDGYIEPLTIELPRHWFSRHSHAQLVTFDRDDFDEVFQSVHTVVGVVRDQIEHVLKKIGCYPKCVFIVGGFGRNRYIHREVKLAITKISSEIQLVAYKNERGWASVSRGAAQEKAMLSTAPLKFDAHYSIITAGGGSVSHLVKKGEDNSSNFTWIRSQDLEVSRNEQTGIQQFTATICRRSARGNPFKGMVKVVWPFYGNRTPEAFVVTIRIRHEGSAIAITFLDHNRSKSVRIPFMENRPIPNPDPIVLHAV